MTDITVLGELLIDFTPEGVSSSGMILYSQNPGGAVANVACTAAKLGRTSSFIGKVGDDMHGRFLGQTLERLGVDTTGLLYDQMHKTTLAFVSLDENGERDFSFYRDPGADTCLRPDEIHEDMIIRSRILHVGSLSMTDEPSASATRKALQIARANHVPISFDPNYRPRLWRTKEAAVSAMREVLEYARLIKLSGEEAELLYGIKDPMAPCAALFTGEIRCAVITMGGQGAVVHTPEGRRFIPAFPVQAVDTTGAGDIFWGAFLCALLQGNDHFAYDSLPALICAAEFGSAAAAISIGRRGAIPSIPTKDEIRRLI